MIQAAGNVGPQPLLFLGLSAENCRRLLEELPIQVFTARLGLPEMAVVLVGAESTRRIHDMLGEKGVTTVLDPEEHLPGEGDSHVFEATGTYGKVPMLLLGLPRERLDGMLRGEALDLDTRGYGTLPAMRVTVVAGETEFTIRDKMIAMGIVTDETIQEFGAPPEYRVPSP